MDKIFEICNLRTFVICMGFLIGVSNAYSDEYLIKKINGIEYTANLTTKEASVTDAQYPGKQDVVILSDFLGYPVTSINTSKFGSKSNPVVSITIPSTINHISASWYKGIQEVHISDLKAWCNIDFGERTKTITKNSKRRMDNPGTSDYTYFTANNPLTFSGKLYLNDKPIEDLVIPEGISEIKKETFCGGNFKSITFVSPIVKIHNNAFAGAKIGSFYAYDLKSWCEMETGLCYDVSTNVEDYLFLYYHTYKNRYGVKTEEDYRYFPLKGDVKLYIDNKVFGADLVIPDGSVTFGNSFGYYTKLETVKIPESVKTFSAVSLEGCDNIKKIDFPSVSFLFEHFLGNYLRTLPQLYIAGEISDGVFEVPSNIQVLKDNTNFYRSPFVKKLIFNSNLKKICIVESLDYPKQDFDPYEENKAGIFEGCKNLKEIQFSEGLEEIENKTFSQCAQLESPNFPNTLREIGKYAFAYCPNLKKVVFPSNIRHIERYAFVASNNISEVWSYAQEYLPTLPEYVFSDQVFDNATLYVPEGLIEKYKKADNWELFKNIVGFDPNSGVEVNPVLDVQICLNGRTLSVVNPETCKYYCLFSADGTIITQDPNSPQNLNPGIYIVNINQLSSKILVK